jgi:hypothetical protein
MSDISGASPDGDRAAPASQPSPSVSGIAGTPSAGQLDKLWAATNGRAWEPKSGLNHPFVAALLDGGWVKICTMRCGFEAFDTGLTWSNAARAYFSLRHASAMSTGTAKTAQPVEGRSPASAVPQADAQPQPVDHP